MAEPAVGTSDMDPLRALGLYDRLPISALAHLTHIPSNEVPGEYSAAGSGELQAGLGVHDQAPPEYTSPHPSNASSPRGSTDHESTPILRRKPTPPPIPSYNDAVAEDMARERSLSHSIDGDGPTS